MTEITDSPELALLSEATHLLANASKVEKAFPPLVSLVKSRMATEVCSLYLLDPTGDELVLAATDGLAQTAVGQVRMHPWEGLTGLVAEVKAPVAVPEAARHPRYRYFPETGEERYHSFLGVPLLRQGAVIGVLIVQTRDARDFSRDEVRTLGAVGTQLAGLLRSERALTPSSARVLQKTFVFPAMGGVVRSVEDADAALASKAQAFYAPAALGFEALGAISARGPSTRLLIGCELTDVERLADGLRETVWKAPLRFAPAGAFDPDALHAARMALVRAAGVVADVTLGVAVDAAASALSVQALASGADFFLFDTTALARSATGGRTDDAFTPAVLRLLAKSLHAAREAGRPSFVVGALVESREGCTMAAGLGADALLLSSSALPMLRKLARRVVPGSPAEVARAALRTHSAAEARAVLSAFVASMGEA